MAVRADSNVPQLDDAVLQQYLIRRDSGPPETVPAPKALTTTAVGGMELDRIVWGAETAPPIKGYPADGFIIWWSDQATTVPEDGGVKVSAASRQFSMLWPAGASRSYAVSAYRNGWAGEATGPRIQHGTWLVS